MPPRHGTTFSLPTNWSMLWEQRHDYRKYSGFVTAQPFKSAQEMVSNSYLIGNHIIKAIKIALAPQENIFALPCTWGCGLTSMTDPGKWLCASHLILSDS